MVRFDRHHTGMVRIHIVKRSVKLDSAVKSYLRSFVRPPDTNLVGIHY
jgi:hypothetical protein